MYWRRPGPYAGPDGQGLTVWVEEVAVERLDDGIARTVHLFQRRVDKVADIRLTAVGDRLFAVRIDGSPGLDWRRHYDGLAYTLLDTPPGVAEAVRGYLASFGLVYGAFDFGLDASGRWHRWHFYECNPNGQFAWFPPAITGRITAAITDQLQHTVWQEEGAPDQTAFGMTVTEWDQTVWLGDPAGPSGRLPV
ncbi:hypothetical protein [Streptomyces sp. CRN 30]|uniref:hypothetical protein n=1 Tax=Streptomyces sp. CRN 30 TaxID=3075613 RepID=UPI002A7F2A70|nr:hypothetical protein [Streptomyces sp. CRN 30]